MTESRFDKPTYEKIKVYLKPAMEQIVGAGRNVREFCEFAVEKLGSNSRPYLSEFLQDVDRGKVRIQGLARSAHTAMLGAGVSADQREVMIREAAYYRAEQRGFSSGSAEADWCSAEREVDARLARDASLAVRGRRVATSATTIVDREIDQLSDNVSLWLEKQSAKSRARRNATTQPRGAKSIARTTTDAALTAAAEKPAPSAAVKHKSTTAPRKSPPR